MTFYTLADIICCFSYIFKFNYIK